MKKIGKTHSVGKFVRYRVSSVTVILSLLLSFSFLVGARTFSTDDDQTTRGD